MLRSLGYSFYRSSLRDVCQCRSPAQPGRTPRTAAPPQRALVTLAIETSCDDTSVAVLEKLSSTVPSSIGLPHSTQAPGPLARVLFHEKVTADSAPYGGIHPLAAQHSHEHNLARLVSNAIQALPSPSESLAAENELQTVDAAAIGVNASMRKPDFISVTRGPGMRSSLNVGLHTAKGLAVAWGVPLLGLHHMQAHALTPRLVSALDPSHSKNRTETMENSNNSGPEPHFPFLTLLVSGGHTMLLKSSALCAHETLATQADVALGDAIDKIARCVLPSGFIAASQCTMYGPALESFVFPNGADTDASDKAYGYEAPVSKHDELQRRTTQWGWGFAPVFVGSSKGVASWTRMEFSFTGLSAAVHRAVEQIEAEKRGFGVAERREMGKEAMRVAFEHVASRLDVALKALEDSKSKSMSTIVISGGVAANGYLRHIIRAYLDAKGWQDVKLIFPPLEFCTDNAVMIGWTGFEMFEAGWSSELSCRSLRKWSLDPNAEDGGILGVSGWKQLSVP